MEGERGHSLCAMTRSSFFVGGGGAGSSLNCQINQVILRDDSRLRDDGLGVASHDRLEGDTWALPVSKGYLGLACG